MFSCQAPPHTTAGSGNSGEFHNVFSSVGRSQHVDAYFYSGRVSALPQ